jgi:hypothetical protein
MPINQQQAIMVMQQYPWQTILLGYGTILDRIAVYIELLRQWRIDAALLSVPDPSDPSVPFYCGVGVLHDGEVYVFLLGYGFPMPGPDGVQIGEDGALQFSSVATLSQLQQDDSLLRRLDLSEEQRFPLTSEMLAQTTAHLFVTPESVSMRMMVLQAELSGDQNMVLYTDPHELRRRFTAASGISNVEYWKYPLRTAFEQRFSPESTNAALEIFLVKHPRLRLEEVQRSVYIQGEIQRLRARLEEIEESNISEAHRTRLIQEESQQSRQIQEEIRRSYIDMSDPASRQHFPLWAGRVLYFKGAISGQGNALTKYQSARVSDRDMIEFRNNQWIRYNPALNLRQFDFEAQLLTIQASYLLGTALFEIDSLPAAKETLTGIRTDRLNAWRYNTEYLLGRIAEREGRYDDARRHYAYTAPSLSGTGNAVRAMWLPKEEQEGGEAVE